jgi:N-acetylglucosamine-6-sulfatase
MMRSRALVAGGRAGLPARGRAFAAAVLLAATILAAYLLAAQMTSANHGGSAAADPSRPNVVFILTDDGTMNLLRFMPHVQAMQRNGMTFREYFVSDSLCCPSRASIFTGELPHDSGVWRNAGAHGGVTAFDRHGDEQRTFAVALQRAGYLTALMGKYLNRYMEPDAGLPKTYVPPGWSEWDVVGWGYPEFDYRLNEDGQLRFHGHNASDYLTDVLTARAVTFISDAADAGRPFFLELAPFAPHSPATPAPRDAHRFAGLRAPRPPTFDVLPTHPPRWLAWHRRLTTAQIAYINAVFRDRVRSIQAVDDMIGKVESALSREGVAGNTYLVVSSDHGYHTGEYRLMPGKWTPFDTDIRVPLIVVGPGVPAGARTDVMGENIDLAETFAAIGGTARDGEGRNLLPILHGQHPRHWRNAILVEHHGPTGPHDDPDFEPPASGNPGPYNAIRSQTFLYVAYTARRARGEIDFYDLRRDPFELHNVAGRLSRAQRRQLRAEVNALINCHGEHACWQAMHVAPTAPKR